MSRATGSLSRARPCAWLVGAHGLALGVAGLTQAVSPRLQHCGLGCRCAEHLVLHSFQPQVTGILIMIINILLTMASSTPVLSNKHVENAGLTVRPKRAGMPSGKVRSADNAAVPALSSHRATQAGTTALAKGPSLTVTVTPATTSAVPNDPSVSRPRTPLLPLPRSPTAVSTTSTGLGTTTDDDDDVRFELLAGMTRKCE